MSPQFLLYDSVAFMPVAPQWPCPAHPESAADVQMHEQDLEAIVWQAHACSSSLTLGCRCLHFEERFIAV